MNKLDIITYQYNSSGILYFLFIELQADWTLQWVLTQYPAYNIFKVHGLHIINNAQVHQNLRA